MLHSVTSKHLQSSQIFEGETKCLVSFSNVQLISLLQTTIRDSTFGLTHEANKKGN
jgi:hypothetical protein